MVKAPSFYAVPTPSLVVPAIDKLALRPGVEDADPRICGDAQRGSGKSHDQQGRMQSD
ncbi:MAG: hypothetical protein QOE18_889, partial [Chloroflexota bacterium]|nr:hypothetical protein [Chloroflexota bacterium]